MKKDALASLLLRLGLVAVFGYAAVAATLRPNDWVGFMPQFLTRLIPALTLLKIFSAYEIVLAVWLLTGWEVFYAAVLSALTVAGIMVANPGALDITFRDIAILLGALALAVLNDKAIER